MDLQTASNCTNFHVGEVVIIMDSTTIIMCALSSLHTRYASCNKGMYEIINSAFVHYYILVISIDMTEMVWLRIKEGRGGCHQEDVKHAIARKEKITGGTR